MSQALESAAVDKPRGFLGNLEDFGQSALHTALESPVNGVIQAVDHAANLHLPELNIIGAPKSDSIGAKAGAVVGAAADLVALSVATGGVADILGGAGVVGGVASAAATGAIYGGLLTPTDNNSKNFLKDRLENGAVSAITFAAMGGAAKALDATGLFAMPAVRSLTGSLTYGGLAGAAGGVANAEATATIKEHKALPSAAELASSVGTQALFGAAFAGMGYAYNKATMPADRVTELDSGRAHIKTTLDANGKPTGFNAMVPAKYDPDLYDVKWNATKMTDGSWSSSAKAISKYDGGFVDNAGVPDIADVTRAGDGSVSVSSTDGDVRAFTQGNYGRSNPVSDAARAKADYDLKYFDRTNARTGEHEVSTESGGYRRTDAAGNTVTLSDKYFGSNEANLEYDGSGAIKSVRMKADDGQPYLYLTKSDADTWTFNKGDDVYSWKGKIDLVKDDAGNVQGVTATSADGKAATFTTESGTRDIATTIDKSAQYESLAPGRAFAKTTSDGELVVRSNGGVSVTVNGAPAIDETAVKPGDDVRVKLDVGDRYAIWEERKLNIGTSATGKPTVGGRVVTDRAIDITKFPAKVIDPRD